MPHSLGSGVDKTAGSDLNDTRRNRGMGQSRNYELPPGQEVLNLPTLQALIPKIKTKSHHDDQPGEIPYNSLSDADVVDLGRKPSLGALSRRLVCLRRSRNSDT